MTGKGHIDQLEAVRFLYNFNLGLLIYIILLSIFNWSCSKPIA